MKPESQRIAIAEAVGIPLKQTLWSYHCHGIDSCGHRSRQACFEDAATYITASIKPVSYEVDAPLPDYCNNLNACHEMEKTLTDEEYWGTRHKKGFVDLLMDLSPNRSQSAPATHRCEAFLKVKDKWVESGVEV